MECDTLRERIAESRLPARYELLEPLASGDHRGVFLARDRTLEERVVLKVAEAESATQAPLREYEWLKTLAHPHLTRVLTYGVDEDAGLSWIALELVRGESLSDALHGADTELAPALLWQACSTLRFLHGGRSVVHGDLKPGNLLVRRRSDKLELVIIDLGLTSRLGDGRPGVVRGTPRYAAPSVLAGDPPTPASDLYALGASFLEALADEPADEAFRAVLDRMVEDDEDTRYRSADHVLRDLRPLVPARVREASIDTEPVFAGRAAELAWVDRWLTELAAGRWPASLVLVSGEPGTGRTRFLDEVARRAAVRGVELLFGRPNPDGHAFQPLRDAILPFASALSASEPGSEGERLRSALDELCAGPAAREGAARVALFQALSECARSRPILISIDDAHLADAPTRALLEAAGRVRLRAPVAFVVSSVSSAAGALSGAAQRHLELERLTREETRAAVRSLLEDEIAAERVVDVADGHPQFAALAARALRIALERGEQDLERSLSDVVPGSLTETVDRELERLATPERQLMDALAAHGEPATAEDVAELLELAQPPRLELAALVERGVLRASAPPPRLLATYELTSELQRKRVSRGIDPTRGAALHARAARLLERRPDAHRRAVAIVEHLLAARDALGALAHAGAALALSAHDPKRVIRIAGALLDGAPSRPEALAVVGEAMADAQGRLGELAPALRTYDAVLEGVEGGPVRRRLLRKSASMLEGLGRVVDARARLLEALRPMVVPGVAPGGAPGEEEHDANSGLERAAACKLMGRVEYELGRASDAEDWLLRGFGAIADPEQSVAASELLNNLGTLAIARSRHDEAREHHEHALAIRERMDDLKGRAQSLANLGTVALLTGDPIEARRHYERALELKRKLGNRLSIALSLSNLAVLDHWGGSYGRAIARYEEALATRVEIGDLPGEVRTRANLAEVWQDKGELARALEQARLAVDLAGGRVDVSRVEALRALASVELCLGRLSEAQRITREGIELARRSEARTEEVLLWSLAGEIEELESERRPPDADAADLRAVDLGRALNDPRALAFALIASAEGRLEAGLLEEAREAAAEAADLAGGRGLGALLARSELVLGRWATAAGSPDEASRHLHRAQDEAVRLATPELVWRSAAALAAFHLHYGRRDRVLTWLERCVGVFRTVVERLGDPELARTYLASPRRASILAFLEEWACVEPPRV